MGLARQEFPGCTFHVCFHSQPDGYRIEIIEQPRLAETQG